MKPRLLVEDGSQAGTEFEIPPDGETGEAVLGRDPACDLYVPDRHLSRRHSRFAFDGESLFVEDLGSTNGTLVNGHRIHEKTVLRDADRVTLGSCSLLVQCEATAQAPQEQKTAVVAETPAPPPMEETPTQKAPAAIGAEAGEEIADCRVAAKISDARLSSVYDARRSQDGAAVTLRVMKPGAAADPQQKARFLRGAQNASRLDHPRLARVLNAGEWEGTPFMVMEHIPGRDLKGLIEGLPRPLGLAKALRITHQILAGLQYVFEQGIVVRTVSPDNILVMEGLDVKIAGYDLLKRLPQGREEAQEITQVMDAGDFVDPSFAAPELLNYPAVADQRTDVFGAGVCLYYMLTRAVPFPEELDVHEPYRAFKRALKDPAELNPAVPGDVTQIILRATSEYLDDRYQTPGEMAKIVEAAQATHKKST